MLTLPDLLQGTTPTYDAQAIPDTTDWQILAAAHQGYGTWTGDTLSGPTVATSTATTTNTNTTALSSLTGSATLAVGSTASLPPGGGYFSAPTTGGGTAYCGFTASSGGNLSNVFYISGGSGSIAAGATITSIFALNIGAGYVMNGGQQVSVAATYLSLVNASGTNWQSLPPSSTDRKDLLVSNTSGTLSIVQGSACLQSGWTRSNGSYTNPPPVKPAWSSSTPIALTEIYVPTGATSIAAANLVDKSVAVTPSIVASVSGTLGADTSALTTSFATILTTGSLGIGTWLLQGVITFDNTSATAGNVEVQAGVNGSGASIGVQGPTYIETTIPGTSWAAVPFSMVILVLTAGTFIVQAKASAGNVIAKKQTASTTGAATGYIATRLA